MPTTPTASTHYCPCCDSYTGEEVVFAVSKGRHHELVPPETCVLIYGPGGKHAGAYGTGPHDLCWFTSAPRARARDDWGRVEGPQALQEMKEELAGLFRGWRHVEALLEVAEGLGLAQGREELRRHLERDAGRAAVLQDDALGKQE